MLPLDSPYWLELRHAYGRALDIPPLLAQLEQSPEPKSRYDADPWNGLWSSLCHQGDAYTASYAAVPHILRICLASAGPVDCAFFQLPACIEIARATGRGPRIPDQLAEAYFASSRQLSECAFKHATREWDQDMTQCVLGALAVAKGHIKLAEAIVNLDGDIMDRIIAGDW